MEDEWPIPDLGAASRAEWRSLRRHLLASGLNEGLGGVVDEVEPSIPDSLRRPLIVDAMRRRRDGVGLLGLVFVFRSAVDAGALGPLIGDEAVDLLVRGNLLRVGDGRAWSGVQIVPFAGSLIVADFPDRGPQAVMAPGPTTAQLMGLLPERVHGRVLDVGTGPGSLGLLAAARGASSVATDINERACAFARFNAFWNELDLDTRAGSLFDPVGGETFDLILSQPPFIVQPESLEPVAYLHAGPMGDELGLLLLGDTPAHLAPGGTALVRIDTPEQLAPLADRVRAAVGSAPVDVVVLSAKGAGADAFSVGYASGADRTLGAKYDETVVAYREHLRSVGIERFLSCVVYVHRTADPATRPLLTETVECERGLPAHRQLEPYLRSLDLVARDNSTLLAARLEPQAGAVLTQEQPLDPDAGGLTYTVRFPPGSMESDGELNESAAALLELFVGGSSVAAVTSAFASVAASTPEGVLGDVLAFARDALRRGILVVAPPRP